MLLAALAFPVVLLALAVALVLRADDVRNGFRPPTFTGRLLVRLDNAGLDLGHHLRHRTLKPRPATTVPPIWRGATS